ARSVPGSRMREHRRPSGAVTACAAVCHTRPPWRAAVSDPRPPARPDDLPALAKRWAAKAIATSHLALSRGEIEDVLRGIAEQLVCTLRSEPFDPKPAALIGERLVTEHVTGTQALNES